MKKRVFSLVLALVLCLGLAPTAAMAADSDFVVENGVLKDYKGSGGDVVIPDGVTVIGNRAFQGCASLTSVTIPASVTELDDDAFEGCAGLTNINIAEGNQHYASQDGIVFNTEKTKLVCYPRGRLGAYTIPDSITEIGWGAFKDCGSLTSVTISDGVTKISRGAFSNCKSLASVTIPNSVTTIAELAFENCTGLTNVNIPNSVTQINGGLHGGAFYHCGLTSLTIPDSLTEIDTRVFAGCENLTSVTIPSNVTEILWGAFEGCDRLTNVTICEGVTKIHVGMFGGAFQSCDSLTSVTIPVSVTEIGKDAFNNCPNLTDIYYGGTQEQWEAIKVPYYAGFGEYGTTTNKDGTLHQSATIHYNSAVPTTTPAPSPAPVPVPVPAAGSDFVIERGVLTQYNGPGGDVVIPDSVSWIGSGAFKGCTGLTSVTIPSRVTNISFDTFEGCASLTDVYYGGTQEQWRAIRIGYVSETTRGFKVYVQDNGDGAFLQSLNIHYNSTAPAVTPAPAPVPTPEPAPAPVPADLAYASTQSVEVDGVPVEFQMYALKDANGNDTNYVKVRDVAFVLKNTSARFSVGWDGSVCLTTGEAYVPNGSEMKTPFSGNRAYSQADAVTKVNGRTVDLAAFVLNDDNGGGYTYYKLRDLGAALGFTVDWSAERGVYVETPAPDAAVPTGDPITLTTQSYSLPSGSVSANVVTVDLSDPRVTVKAALPDGMLDRTADFAAQAQASGADVVVNGNFFNMSDAVKDPVGHVMIDGTMVYGNSGRSTLGITSDNKAIMGRPGLFYRVESPDGSLWWDAFEVNMLKQFAGQAVLYTPARGASVSIGYPGYVLQVENDVITDYRQVAKGASEAIPANGYLVYFSTEVASTDWHMTPVMGRQVRVRPYVASDNGESFSMDGVTAMVNGAPRLVRGGAIETFEEPEVSGIRKNSATNRTAVGIRDGGATLVLVTSPAATVQQMRELMLALGCAEAMNLDGGGSSALYYRGQMITTPARALATTLQVFVAK